MRFLEISGTRYEMGKAEGEAFATEIRAWYEHVVSRFEGWDDERFERARREACTLTEEICPYLIEQIRGLGDGAGLSFQQAHAMNFYTTLAVHAIPQGCSNVAFTSTPDGPIVAGALDFPGHREYPLSVVIERPDDGPVVLGQRVLGFLMLERGVNEHGIAMGSSSLTCDVPEPRVALNAHFSGAQVLRFARSVDEGIETLTAHPAPRWGRNTVILSAGGDVACVEQSGEHHAVRRAENGAIWCTNKPLAESMLPLTDHSNPTHVQDSTDRVTTMQRMSSEADHSADLARQILSHSTQPGAICRYAESDPISFHTVSSYIAYPAQKKVEYCETKPDRDPWETFRL